MRGASQAAKGAAAGAAATVPMSAVMVLAQRAGYLGEQPPKRVTKAALDFVGAAATDSQAKALAPLNHLAFGALTGALYGVARQRGPHLAADFIAGLAYGLAVWLVSYEGWIPAMGILPKVQWDRPGRPESMALAHAVFGLSLAGVLRRLRA